MAVFAIAPTDRTFVYPSVTGQTFIQWGKEGDDDAVKIIFASGWNFTPSMTEFQVDRIDSADPIYTRISDVIGTFTVNLKSASSLFDPLATPANEVLLSHIIAEIAAGKPPVLIFAPVIYAKDGTGAKYVNLVFKGRVMDMPFDQSPDQGMQDITISGEVIEITKVRRETTANTLG